MSAEILTFRRNLKRAVAELRTFVAGEPITLEALEQRLRRLKLIRAEALRQCQDGLASFKDSVAPINDAIDVLDLLALRAGADAHVVHSFNHRRFQDPPIIDDSLRELLAAPACGD
jgi:hypothetical protein